MKQFFSVILLLTFSIASSFGQNITYDGKITDLDSQKDLANVTVTVLSGGSMVSSAKSSASGDYSVQFLPGKKYTIKYSKSGFVSKIITVDVGPVIGEDLPAGGKIFPPINIDLFTERVGVDFSFLEAEPVVKWSLDKGDRMNYDKGHMLQIKNKIESKLKEAQNKEKNVEAEYNQLIKEADEFYKGKKFNEALDKYVAALQIEGKQKEAHPNARLLQIEELLKKKEEEQLEYQQENQAYLNLITAADNLANNKEYDKAISKYNEASIINSGEQYPKDRVRDLKDEKANAAKRAEYDKLIKRADGFLKQNSVETARDTYLLAQKIFPKEEYPAAQLKILSVKIDALTEERDKKDNYNKAVAAADELYKKKDYVQAIEKYKEALSYESAATFPAERIKIAQGFIDEQEAAAKKIEDFNKLVAQADAHVNTKEFEDAVSKYTEALTLMEDETVQTKLEKAKESLADQKNKEKQQEQIAALLASAQEKMENEAYTKAIEDFSAILAIVETHSEAIAGKKKAEGLLADMQSQQEKDDKFNELVAIADKAYDAKTWQEAKTQYLAAKAVYNDREHVNNRIIDVEEKIAAENLNDEIGSLMNSANEKLSKEDFTAAIVDFEAVLKVQAGHKEAIAGKKKAEELLAKRENQEAEETTFKEIVAQADVAFDKKDWAVAKERYLAAKAIFDDREHVNNRLTLVEAEINKAQSEEENLAKIQALLDEAAALKPENKWAEVIQKYELALGINEKRADISEMLEAAKTSKKAWEAAQFQEELEGEFNSIVAIADKAFDSKEWENARDKYLAAKAIFQDRKHVNTRIEEVNSLISDLQKEKEDLAKIQTLLDEAEALKPDNKWADVVQKYETALKIDEERKDVSELLAVAKQSKIDWEASQSKDQLFNQLKLEGNELVSQEKWIDAKSKFEAALEINKDNEIDASLALIEKKLAEEAASKGLEEQFKAKMEIAEEFAKKEEYTSAMNSFKEALEIKEDDVNAKSRIKEMQDKLDALAQLKNADVRYDEAMALGNKSMVEEDYSAAIKAFDDALLEKPSDAEATRLKEEAKAKIKALQLEEEKYIGFVEAALAKYDEAIANGNSISKLTEAKSIFASAQKIRPEASLPQTKIVEIDNLLRKIEEDAAANSQAAADKNKLYQDQLQLASVAAQDNKYKNAIEYLKEAQKIKPEESFPATEIKKFQLIIDNESAQKELNANYSSIIDKADLAFNNKNYKQSIGLYKDALEVKSDETYPKSQIAKAQEEIENSAKNELYKEYRSFMDKADAEFLNKEFEKALSNYKSALSVKKNDADAKDRIDETQQILNNFLKAQQESESQKERFNQLIAEADQLFNGEKYLAAKTVYEKALKIDANDAHANERVKLCIEKDKENVKKNQDLRYNQSIASADRLFKGGEYDKASEAYKRALSLRSYEQYPRTQLAQIEAIKNANVKAQGSVDYLGEQSNISILEGAALLERGEIQRERMKQEEVANHLRRFEGAEADRSLSDYSERMAFENEVTEIKNRRDQSYLLDVDSKRNIVNEVDSQLYDFEKKSTQLNKFKEGDLSRTNQELVFMSDDFNQEKVDFTTLHKDAIEQIKIIENKRSDKNSIELKHHDVKVTATKEELTKIENQYEEYKRFNEEFQKNTERSIENQLRSAEEQYKAAQEGKDDARLMVLEKLKAIDQDQLLQNRARDNAQENKTQANNQEVESIRDMNTEKALQNVDDLIMVDNEVKSREQAYERAQQNLIDKENNSRERTIDQLLTIDKKGELSRQNKDENIKENYEELKEQEISIENKNHNIDYFASKDKQEVQKYVDALENNSIKYTETIANTIGDDYPEGVTQENYVREDSKGIPIKIVTRRIVVTDGRGEVFIRTQTRNGLTYSNNGSPITEQNWINGTENANLEKHY